MDLFFLTEEISQEEFLNKVNDAIEELSVNIKKQFNKKIRIIAFKDYFEDDVIHESESFFKGQNLYKVQVQPNMIISDSNRMEY